ncbi:hypothetical protein C8R44DRAFT_888734 [Mycena epipterygia]|nr:hypothetical protein C8R44DRAFT_888734 [Mycena epipterygia]
MNSVNSTNTSAVSMRRFEVRSTSSIVSARFRSGVTSHTLFLLHGDELNPEHDDHDVTALTHGFDYLFTNQIGLTHTSFLLLGLGVCAFLEAALGMESGLVGEMARLLTLGEARAGKPRRMPKRLRLGRWQCERKGQWRGPIRGGAGVGNPQHGRSSSSDSRMHFRNPQSDMGYFQCMYALNTAHSKFIRTVFPGARASFCCCFIFTHPTHIDFLAGVCHGHARFPVPVASRCLAQEKAE